MRKLYILLIAFFVISCKTTRPTITSWNTRTFNLLKTNDTINLRVTFFVKNSAYCYNSAGIPYAILIGKTENIDNIDIPETITVLALCDNKNYIVGQNIKIAPLKDPTRGSGQGAIDVVKDTVINNEKYRWLVGSENPAIWGKVL